MMPQVARAMCLWSANNGSHDREGTWDGAGVQHFCEGGSDGALAP
jgi:hypothetical protein